MILKSRTTSACFPFFFLHRSGNGALTSKYSARQVCFHYIFVTRNTMNFHPFSLCIIGPLHLPVSLMIDITELFNYGSLILVFWSLKKGDWGRQKE